MKKEIVIQKFIELIKLIFLWFVRLNKKITKFNKIKVRQSID